jgi:hypothetical protein
MRSYQRDYLSRRPVVGVLFWAMEEDERKIAERLPKEYFFDDGIFRFPAGLWESYFIDGKDYNPDGDTSLESQKESIVADLVKEGFGIDEANEFIQKIQVKEGTPMRLEYDASLRWLKHHKEFQETATKKLKEVVQELRKESGSEPGRRMKFR